MSRSDRERKSGSVQARVSYLSHNTNRCSIIILYIVSECNKYNANLIVWRKFSGGGSNAIILNRKYCKNTISNNIYYQGPSVFYIVNWMRAIGRTNWKARTINACGTIIILCLYIDKWKCSMDLSGNRTPLEAGQTTDSAVALRLWVSVTQWVAEQNKSCTDLFNWKY